MVMTQYPNKIDTNATKTEKVEYYQKWYGGSCPYKKPNDSNNGREYMRPLSRGIDTTSAHKAILLGPKRPASAVRTVKATPATSKRPHSALRCKKDATGTTQSKNDSFVLDLSEEDNAVLQIRAALVKANKSARGLTTTNAAAHDETKDSASNPSQGSPTCIQSIKCRRYGGAVSPTLVENDTLSLRRIVPSIDKNYLRPRPPPKLSPRQSPDPSPRRTSPHPELYRRSLFVGGIRDAVENQRSEVPEKCIPSSPKKNVAEKKESKSGKAKPPINKKSQSNQQPASASRRQSVSSQRSRWESVNDKSRRFSESSAARRQSVNSQRRASHSSQKSKKGAVESSVSELEDGSDVFDDAPVHHKYAVGMMVEARYKGRAHWWTGTIVNLRLDGTYDIQYGDLFERHVPETLIREKATVDVDKVKRKIRLTGFLARISMKGFALSGSFHSEGGSADEEDDMEYKAVEYVPKNESSSASPAVLNRRRALSSEAPEEQNYVDSSPNAERKTLVRRTIAQHMAPSSAPVAPSLGVDAVIGGQTSGSNRTEHALHQGRPNFLAGLKDGMKKLKKVEVDPEIEKKKADEEEAAKEHEKSEQLRLWPEVEKVVGKGKLEIPFEDLNVVSEIGRGKFASVYSSQLNVKLHTKVFTVRENLKRTLERVGNNLNNRSGSSMVIDTALKVFEYKRAYPLTSGDWKNDKPNELDYADPSLYTDGVSSNSNQNSVPYTERYDVMPPSKSILEALREIRALHQLQHPNIVMLHGVVMKPRLILIIEKMQTNLADILATPPDNQQIALTTAQRVHVLYGIVKALAFMHTKRYTHRDIKCHNVLLTSGIGGYEAKLADFGTAVRIPNGRMLNEAVGTSGYTAPEVSNPGNYDFKADIFSMAILQWETLQPYDRREENPLCGQDLSACADMIIRGVRPSLDHCLVPKLHSLINKCWQTGPSSRPSADTLFHEYDRLIGEA